MPKTLHEVLSNSGCLGRAGPRKTLPTVSDSEDIAKRKLTCKVLRAIVQGRAENLINPCCPRRHDLLDSRTQQESWICLSYPFCHEVAVHYP